MNDVCFSISEDFTEVVQNLMAVRKKIGQMKKFLSYAESVTKKTTPTEVCFREWNEVVDWAKEQIEKISGDFSLCAHNAAFYADSFELKGAEEEWPV